MIPGGIAGALIAVAWWRSVGGRASAWFAFALAPFAIAPFLEPGALWVFLTTGLGGGAIAVPATGLLGGFAAGQRGPLWVRALCGVLWAAMAVGFALTPALVGGLPPSNPRGAWLIVLVVGLMVVLSLACIAPFRRREADAAASGEAMDRLSAAREKPDIFVFDDLADLFLADPIHDVEEPVGWPAVKKG